MNRTVANLFHQHRPWTLGLVLTSTLGVLTSCATPSDEGTREEREAPATSAALSVTLSAEQIQHGAIKWSPVQPTSTTEAIEIPGHLVPNEDEAAHLSAPVRGMVVAVHVRLGDRVSRGQPLVTLQSQDATAARAEHAKAVAELNARQAAASYARVARERADRLLELKAMSRQEVEHAHTEEQLATAARVQAEADVERARTTLAQLGVETETGNIVLRTPLAGIVLSREATPGSVVDAGTHLVLVSNVNTLWLDIAATERVATALRPGAHVQFTVPAFPADTFEASIQNVGGALDSATRTLQVRGVVRNPSAKLRPEMFATVKVELGEPRVGVTVISGAVQLLDQRPVVFVAHPDDKGGARFERRDVEIGARTDAHVQIVRGLGPGDLVVTAGAFMVKSEFTRAQMPAGT
jgi:cobalt-zinc-cadmium efflux system membrane fusion protein